jgi:hypothetical protein
MVIKEGRTVLAGENKKFEITGPSRRKRFSGKATVLFSS